MRGHFPGGNLDEELLRVEESSPLATPQPAKRGVHWVFVGSDGLRAGWGVLLFVLLYVGFLFLTGWALRSFLLRLAM